MVIWPDAGMVLVLRMARPPQGTLDVLRCAFDGEPGRQMIDDLIGNLFAIVHIDGHQPLFLIDKGMSAAGLEEEAGKQKALGGGGAKRSSAP